MSLSTRSQQRLNDIDDILALYYEKLKIFQNELAIALGIDAKFAIENRIKRDILPYIKKYETEYASLLASELLEIEMSDKEAEEGVAEIKNVIMIIKETAQEAGSEDLVKSVEKAQKALERPTTAKGKLQAAIPIIPGIMSYQLEIDTHSTLMSLWEKLKAKFK